MEDNCNRSIIMVESKKGRCREMGEEGGGGDYDGDDDDGGSRDGWG